MRSASHRKILPSLIAGMPALVAITLVCSLAGAQSSRQNGTGGVFIYIDKTGALQIEEADPASVEKAGVTGLFVWPVEEDAERWALVSPGWKMPTETERVAAAYQPVREPTRGGVSNSSGPDAAQLTFQLAQISPDTATRNAGVYPLTPANGTRLLNPRPTFRRLPLEKEPRFPATVGVLTSDDLPQAILVGFPAGIDRVTWADLKNLPAAAKEGLPAGRYILGPQKGAEGAFATFLVEDPMDRARILRPVEEMGVLVKDRSDPLFVQFSLEHFLQFRGEEDAPVYLPDALDLLESVPAKQLTPHLRGQRDRLVQCLQAEPNKRGEALAPVRAGGDDTKVPELEQVRQWIASNQWRKAIKELDDMIAPKKTTDPRTLGLALLYRGVVLTESGQAQEAEAREAFTAALEALQTAPAADRFRAHVNFANFLQRLANDRLNNHALQMAAGVPQPFLTALRSWLAARSHYQSAGRLADEMKSPAQKAVVQVSVARLYALLGDVIRTLAGRSTGRDAFVDGETAAAKIATDLAADVAHSSLAEGQVRGIAAEVVALLAYRGQRGADAEAAARRALAFYLDAGHLAGAENVYRVLGLIAERQGDQAAALARFQVAQLISESLRERFPLGNAGLTRAGFFARKAYANEKIVELLLAANRPTEALHYLELAKARSLQDVLAARNLPSDPRVAAVGQVLAKWPADTAALEYFFAAEEGHVLVVAPGGRVTAHRLCDQGGKPIVPRELFARVRRILWDTERQAGKLYQRLSSRRGYDNSWQDEMHRLYHELLPASARQELQGAKTVVVVPQHILHYFPFAALVSEPDGKASKARMANPRFLLDEPFDLVYAPSLTSWHRLPAASARQVWAVAVADAPGAVALDGVKKDLANLQATFGAAVKGVIDGEGARESVVKKVLSQRGLLFFGAHGLNLADQPLESYLMLFPDDDAAPAKDGLEANDGRLTAAELFARRINAEIVVMSACYSGLGDRSPLPGDDLFGLQRAFLQSGVRTVVSGLWDVYDGTAPDLMLEMFKGLVDGKTVPASLAGSQRTFLRKLRSSGEDEPWLHPYFWAVYTAAGDDRTRFLK